MAALNDSCMAEFQKLSHRKYRYIIYGIKDLNIQPFVLGSRKDTFLDMQKHLSDKECRYIVYDHEYLAPGDRPTGKLLFLFWKPLNCNDREKVTYSEALGVLRGKMDGLTNHNLMSFGDIDDLLGNEWIKDKGYTRPQDKAEESEESDEDFD